MKARISVLVISMLLLAFTGQAQETVERRQVKGFLKALDAISGGISRHSSMQPDFRQWVMQSQGMQPGYYDYRNEKRVQVGYLKDDKADTLLNQKLQEDMARMMDRKDVQESVKGKEKARVKTDAFHDSLIIERLNSIPTNMQYTYNQKVKSFIKMYLEKRPRQVAVMAGLSKHYFPIFERVLDMEGLPLELKYLPIIESALNANAYSHAGAAGLWQFMLYTGKMYGLDVNTLVDERRDPIKSTYAAAEHLKALYDKYENWSLVIAAYNCGQGRVDRAIRRTGKHDFWDIYYYLPRETRGYVPAFIAANYVMNFYQEYGIEPVAIEMPEVAASIDINQKLHLKQIAEYLQLKLDYLKELNPQYRYNIIPAGKKQYKLRLPQEAALKFAEAPDSVYQYKKEQFLQETRKKKVASRSQAKKSRYNPPDKEGKAKVYYKIRQGDNVGFIAEWFDVRASDLRYWNNLRGNRIVADKKLLVYVPEEKKAQYSRLNSMTFVEKQEFAGNSTTQSYQSNGADNDNYVYYKVRRGDNLWTISKKFPGVSNVDIKNLNNLNHRQVQHLKPGMVIKIKKKG